MVSGILLPLQKYLIINKTMGIMKTDEKKTKKELNEEEVEMVTGGNAAEKKERRHAIDPNASDV